MTVEYGGLEFKSLKISGNSVLLEKVSSGDLQSVNGIYLPVERKFKNNKIGTGKVLQASTQAMEEFGIGIGDYVLYDYYAAHGDYPDKVIVNATNLLLKMNKKEMENFLGADFDEGFAGLKGE